ncbi:MAG TPA: hypothetical protein VIJ18_07380 [Microbacteriaceae bacterium]
MLRIRRTRWKFAYVVLGIALLMVLNAYVFSRVLPSPVAAVASNVLVVALYFVGTRSFRGAGEPIEPPRAWWRMTSRPTAGFVIGSLLALSVISDIAGARSAIPGYAFTNSLDAVVDSILVVLYVHSSMRLVRSPAK